VPAYPLNANSSLSHAGPMTRTVTDAALMLSAMTGYDPRDPYALPQDKRDWRIGLDDGVARLRIAYAPTLNAAWVEPRIADLVREAVRHLAELGATIEEAEPPLTGAETTLMTIYRAGLCAVVNGLPPAARGKLDPDLAALAAEGKGIGLDDYFDAIKAREALSVGLNSFFQRYDALVLPTMPITAIEAGRLVPADGRYKAFYQWIPFTGPFNLTKVPAASIPCGFVDGLPAGLQIVGPMFREDIVLRICRAYESANPIPLPKL
jgi:aspartyl-tRNA(Asn)/glutamyl-tRNA(Gln) amidotransferase subunit A